MAICSVMLTLGAADNPVDHVVNHPFWTVNGWWVWSSHIGNLVLTGTIMLLFFPRWAARIGARPASDGNARFIPADTGSHLFEVFCVYLRDTIARPVLREKTDRFMPFLWTVFFFILINNLLGLMPILEFFGLVLGFAAPAMAQAHRSPFGATATGNIWVTGALALMAGSVFIINSLRTLGVGGFLKHMTGGAPPYMWPLLVPIELVSTFLIKVGALAIRLFANMTAGHVLIATLYMFVSMSIRALPVWGSAPISIVAVVATIAIYFLELFVAVLQAFIFMFLTTIFIGQLSSHGHDDAHAHDHHAAGAGRPAGAHA